MNRDGADIRAAVIGGGWAGLAAAAELRDAGCRVAVYEAGRVPGGRARRVERDGTAAPLDNGQHILLGAYGETLALMRRLGRDPDALFLRRPLHLESADGRLRIAAPRLPSPLHAACALLFARGLPLGERLAAIRLMRRLRAAGWSAPPDWTVARLLDQHRQPTVLRDRLWTPLCLAALNTPPRQASAVLFAAVLRDSLAGPREASDLLLPATDLSGLWADAAAARVDWRPGHRVRSLGVAEHDTDAMAGSSLPSHATLDGYETGLSPSTPGKAAASRRYTVGGDPYDAVILAVPPDAAAPLLAGLPGRPEQSALLQALDAFEYLPIATVTLTLAAPWRLPAPMLMLFEDAARGHAGQWLFDRAALTGRGDAGELAIVISAAGSLPGRDDTMRLIEEQVRAQTRRAGLAPMPAVAARTMITEKRATFAAAPGLPRPGASTPWPGLFLAGDWTDTGYPGVLEGAVRSGLAAARLLLEERRI